MVDPFAAIRVGHRALFFLLAGLIIFVRILPLSTTPASWPGPDLLLCLTVVWVLRRPDYIPALAVAIVFFLDDLVSLRAPGLWSLVVLVGTEFLRTREAATRDLPFLLEWVFAAAVIAGMIFANRFALALFMVPQAGSGQALVQFLATVLTYPVLALMMQWAIGLRRAAPGEVDALGHRL